MSEQTYAEVTMPEKAVEFLESVLMGDECPIIPGTKSAQIECCEANMGEMPEITDLLKELSIPFTQSWGSGRQFDAGGRTFDGQKEHEHGSTDFGDVIVSASDLSNIINNEASSETDKLKSIKALVLASLPTELDFDAVDANSELWATVKEKAIDEGYIEEVEG